VFFPFVRSCVWCVALLELTLPVTIIIVFFSVALCCLDISTTQGRGSRQLMTVSFSLRILRCAFVVIRSLSFCLKKVFPFFLIFFFFDYIIIIIIISRDCGNWLSFTAVFFIPLHRRLFCFFGVEFTLGNRR
jgi:hypothetical protein